MEAWKQVEQAEERLEQRAGQRTRARERRRRRVRVATWTARILLPVVGAAVFVGVLQAEGGDLGGWPRERVIAFLAAVFAVPAALAAWLARREGWLLALASAVGTFGAQGALVFGVAVGALGLGPQ